MVGGKGNISCISINLVRIALKSKNTKAKETDYRLFYQELEKVLKQAKDALLERFELQVDKTILHFPTLYQLGTWHDGEKLKDKDRLRKLLKHGTLAFHIVGLSEAIYREAVCLLRCGIGLLCSRSCHYLYGRRRYFPDQKNDRKYPRQYSGNHL